MSPADEDPATPQVPPPPPGTQPSGRQDDTGRVRCGSGPGSPHPAEPTGGDPRGDTPETAFWVPWRWPEAVAVALLAQVVAFVLLTVLHAADPDRIEAWQIPVSGLTFVVSTVGWVALRHRGHVRRLLGPLRPTARHVLAGVGHGVIAFLGAVVGLGTLLQILADRMGVELPPVQEQLDELTRNPETLPYVAVAVVATAPIGEELFFRGLLLQALRRRVHLWPAIGLSAVAFAIVHVEPLAMLIVFPVGMYLGWIFHRSGTLMVPLVAHASFNMLILGFMLMSEPAGAGAGT